MSTRRRLAALLIAIAALIVIIAGAPRYTRAMSFVVRAAGIGGWPGTIARWEARPVVLAPISAPTRYGAVKARLYRPDGTARHAVILVSGIHPFGIDESRLTALARELAATGLNVVTPEVPDLTRFLITAQSTDVIEDVAAWVAGDPRLSTDGRVGLMGISFSGGLSVVAAGRPSIRQRTAFVFSLGGHGDLPRVLRYLCTGIEPTGHSRPPHDYGLAVVLFGLADEMVPADQVPSLRQAIKAFLWGSALDRADRSRAGRYYDEARALEASLLEPSATLMHAVNTRAVQTLGARVLPHIGILGGDPDLSPERSPAPAAPVYLLHGTEDNVIPAVESTLLAAHLSPLTHVHLLASALITHAEVDRPSDVWDVWTLMQFWEALLEEENPR